VNSLHVESVCQEESIREILPQNLLTYEEAIQTALSNIAQNRVPSVWYDSLSSGDFSENNLLSIHVPEHGVYTDSQSSLFLLPSDQVIDSVWSLGGEKGWPSIFGG